MSIDDRLLKIVSRHTGVSAAMILSNDKHQETVRARTLYVVCLRRIAGRAYVDISTTVGMDIGYLSTVLRRGRQDKRMQGDVELVGLMLNERATPAQRAPLPPLDTLALSPADQACLLAYVTGTLCATTPRITPAGFHAIRILAENPALRATVAQGLVQSHGEDPWRSCSGSVESRILQHIRMLGLSHAA